MKKVIAIVLTAVMVLSCNMTAFATINGETSEGASITTSPVNGEAKWVSASDGDNLVVNGSVRNPTDSLMIAVAASGGAQIEVKEIISDSSTAIAIRAIDGAKVMVNSDVTEIDAGDAIRAQSGATVKIGQDVTESGDGDAINANNKNLIGMSVDGSHVTVEGSIEENGTGNAILAGGKDTEVIVNKDVTENGEGNAINAYDNSTVMVKGNVEENDTNNAITAISATVMVNGNVVENDHGNAIEASGNSTVKVGGNVKESGDGFAIGALDTAKVIVEGLVTGEISQNNTAEIYLGQLDGSIDNKKYVHYLIGTKQGGNFIQLGELTVSGDVVGGAVDGINKSYQYTTTADIPNGSIVNIKSATNKKLKVDSSYTLPTGLTINAKDDGSLELVIDSTFVGGLQDLMIVAADIVKRSNSGSSSKTIFTGTTGNPVTNGKWAQNADGIWSYATAYKFTDTWGYIANPNDANSAAWYYFDRNGNMLTGWQKLYWNGAYKWFYFSKTKDANEGKCQLGGITPEGYKVGADGAWIED